MRLGDDDVEAAWVLPQANERGAERDLFDIEAVPAQALVLDGCPPVRGVADDDDASASGRRTRERTTERDRVRPVAHRPGDDDVAGGTNVHARDAPREREIG